MSTIITSSLKLASAGDDIKIWEPHTFCSVHQFAPCPSTIFRSLHWSPDCHQLVFVPTGEKKVFLTLIKNSALHSIEVVTGVETSCAKFSNLSPRYLGIGTTTGSILMWDLKIQKPKKVFTGQNEVTCLQFNQKDSCIASGCRNGDIILHSLTTGQSLSPLRASKVQHITDVQYNNFRMSLLGSASDDGAIYLWDTNAHSLIHQYAASHDAPATGLVFSPINNSFLVSVGLDKKIICYDTQMKSCVKVLSCEAPFSAVDFMEDGTTLAVGSTRGKIYIYDLRSSSVPLKVIDAHSVSVQSLAFQKIRVKTSGKVEVQKKTLRPEPPTTYDFLEPIKNLKILPESNKSSISDGLGTNQVCSSGNLAQKAENICSNEITSYFGIDSLSEAFSPLKDGTLDEPPFSVRKQPIGGGAGEGTTGIIPFESKQKELPSFENLTGMCDASVKPDEGLIHKAPCSSERIVPKNLNYHESKISPLISPAKVKLSAGCLQEKSLEPLISISPDVTVSMDQSSSSKSIHALHNNVAVSNWLSETFISKYDEQMNANAVSERQETSTQKEIQELAERNCSGFYKKIVSEIEARNDNILKDQVPLPPFQVEFVRQIVQDAMEEFSDKLRHDLFSLHAQMIRQFQNQMVEIRALMEKCSLNEELAAEIERLQEENRQLRTTF